MMLRGMTRDEASDLVVGHAFHDHRSPSITSSSTKSIWATPKVAKGRVLGGDLTWVFREDSEELGVGIDGY